MSFRYLETRWSDKAHPDGIVVTLVEPRDLYRFLGVRGRAARTELRRRRDRGELLTTGEKDGRLTVRVGRWCGKPARRYCFVGRVADIEPVRRIRIPFDGRAVRL